MAGVLIQTVRLAQLKAIKTSSTTTQSLILGTTTKSSIKSLALALQLVVEEATQLTPIRATEQQAFLSLMTVAQKQDHVTLHC
jgi:hypothetical protein